MKRYGTVPLALFLLVAPLQAQSGRIGVDPRVELMSIIFRLAGNDEYQHCRIPAYNAAIDQHFASFRDHEAIQLARELRSQDGVSYDAVMSMAIHLKDVESLAERVPFDHAPDLDGRWHGAKARPFLKALRKFVVDSDFAGFLKSQQQLFDVTDTRLRAFVTNHADFPWFDRFFGPRTGGLFIVVPGLASGGGGSYGPKIKLDNGVEEIYANLGVWRVDAEGLPYFDSDWTSTLVHEFAHSYANPLIEKFQTQFQKSGARLFEAVSEQMRRQAYGHGHTVLCESLVRASTTRYILDHEGQEAASRAVAQEQRNGFLWTGELFAVLGKYAADR